MAVSKRLRFEILRRDNHTCRYCGRSAPEVKLTIDHVVPETLGGTDDPSNLVAACGDCNSGKSSVPADAPLVGDVEADALRWATAMQHVAAIRVQQVEDRRAIVDRFRSLWDDWTYGPAKKPIPLPDGYDAVLRFVDAGLSEPEIQELLTVAMRASHIRPADTWRYFCGCCWRRIRENADMAAELIAAEEADG